MNRADTWTVAAAWGVGAVGCALIGLSVQVIATSVFLNATLYALGIWPYRRPRRAQ